MLSTPSALSNRRKLSVAPMLDWTDRHCRYFHRLLTKNALLYTEMVTTGALIHGDVQRHLGYNGIVSHANCRADKADIGPAFDWNKVIQAVNA